MLGNNYTLAIFILTYNQQDLNRIFFPTVNGGVQVATNNLQPTPRTISQQHQTTLKIITQNPKHVHKTLQVSFNARQNLPTSVYAKQNVKPQHCKQPSQALHYMQNCKAPLQNAHNLHNGGSMVSNHADFGNYAQNQTNLYNQQQLNHANTQNLKHGYQRKTAALQNQNYRQPQVQSLNNCYQNLPNNTVVF